LVRRIEGGKQHGYSSENAAMAGSGI